MTAIDFEKEAAEPSSEQLELIASLANKQRRLETEIQQAEAKLLLLHRDLRQVQETDLPDAMLAAECRAFTLSSGDSIKIDDGLSASLSAEKKPAACEWLRNNGYGDIVSEQVLLTFGKGKQDDVKRVVTLLLEQNLKPAVKTDVNTATLKALIRENMRKGVDMPLDTLGAYVWRKAIITRTERP